MRFSYLLCDMGDIRKFGVSQMMRFFSEEFHDTLVRSRPVVEKKTSILFVLVQCFGQKFKYTGCNPGRKAYEHLSFWDFIYLIRVRLLSGIQV